MHTNLIHAHSFKLQKNKNLWNLKNKTASCLKKKKNSGVTFPGGAPWDTSMFISQLLPKTLEFRDHKMSAILCISFVLSCDCVVV